MRKYITDVDLLKDLLGHGGKHTFIRKNEASYSPFAYLQSEVLITFCTLKSCTDILVGQIEPDIAVEKINRGLMLNLNFASVGS